MSEIDLLKRMLEREKQARKAAETLMEQKSRELYAVNQGLRQMTEELTQARNIASQANQAKSSFLASMFHELRTPLLRRGYQVLIAVDGPEGVAKAQTEVPDLILMDMSLPVTAPEGRA